MGHKIFQKIFLVQYPFSKLLLVTISALENKKLIRLKHLI